MSSTTWRFVWLVSFGLALATLLIHGSALFAGWKFDDGPQLKFAATYSPWEYFCVIEVMRQQSYAHIAPWNALFFDIGLPLFGLQAAGHYAHLLVVIWFIAVATYSLLARWLSQEMAIGGALLFLAMPSTGAVAHMLMTGHYAYGLGFSVLMLLAFARAVQANSVRWAMVSAAFYWLACLCKELYVPLVAVVLMWPGLDRRARLVLTTPVAIVAAGYALLRLHVLGGIGGYAALAGGSATLGLGADSIMTAIDRMRSALFGAGWMGLLALSIVILGTGAAWWRGRRAAWPWLAVCGAVVLMPILPLLLFPVPNGLERIMFLAGWSSAILAVWHFEALPARRYAIGIIFILLLMGQRGAVHEVESSQRSVTAQNAFIVRAGPNDVLVPAGFSSVGLLETMRMASTLVSGRTAPVLVGTEDEFLALGAERGRLAWEWHDDCDCVRQLGEGYLQRVKAILLAWTAGNSQTLDVRLQLDDAGRVKVFRWSVAGPEGELLLEVRDELRLALPRQGAMAFGLDTTFHPADPVNLRLTVITPTRAAVRSPWLSLSLNRSSVLEWKGRGTNPPSTN